MARTSAAGAGSPTSQPVTPQPILDAGFAFARTQILVTAVELDVFSLIEAGHDTLEELARVAHASPRGLRMLLNALVAQKYLLRNRDRYELSELARRFLVRNSPQYIGALTLHARQIMQNWSHLTDVIRNGRPAVEIEGAQDDGEFFAQFVEGLYSLNVGAAEAAAKAVLAESGSQPVRVLDIGAGSGVWGIAFAGQQREARVTAVDRARVIEAVTRPMVERHGVGRQFEYLQGDFQEVDFGEGRYDLAVLGHICHSEGVNGTRKLLRKIARALVPGGRLLVAEFLCDESRSEADFPLTFALNMLVHTAEGDTFTPSELTGLLHEAGFGAVSPMAVPAPSPVLVAKKTAAQERAA